eukprot:754984-Hanusia_phi.AAC.1
MKIKALEYYTRSPSRAPSHPYRPDVELFKLLLHVAPRVMIPFVAAQQSHTVGHRMLTSPGRFNLLAHLVQSLLKHVTELDGCNNCDHQEIKRNQGEEDDNK